METPQSLSKLTPDATIEQIIAANNQAGELLASIGLAVSEHEKETLRSVCQQQQWSEVEVLNWIKKHSANSNGKAESYGTESQISEISKLTEWTDYLERELLNPGQSLLEELNRSFPRVLKIHGNQYTWLKNMKWHFNKFDETLGMYYAFERKKFFPLVDRLATNKKKSINHGDVQKLERSFKTLVRDQERLQRQMTTIEEKGNNFNNPPNACSTLRIQNKNFTVLFSKLRKQFEIEYEHLIPQSKEKLQAKK